MKRSSRIFGNIINNAVKYSDGDLSVSLTEDGTITFSNHAAGLTEVQVGQVFRPLLYCKYSPEVNRGWACP